MRGTDDVSQFASFPRLCPTTSRPRVIPAGNIRQRYSDFSRHISLSKSLLGCRSGIAEEPNHTDRDSLTLRGRRNRALLSLLIGCGLRRAEVTALRLEDLQLREGHWVVADLRGKGGHIRTIPVPHWVKEAVDSWTVGAGITSGPLLRSINKAGRIWGLGFTPKVIWAIVKANAKSCGLPSVAPHDLRRTCARLCHQAGGELDQIQFLLGHVSIQTTERYLGCKQRFHDAVNDHIGLEPDAPS